MHTDDRLKFARRCPAGSRWQTDTPRFFTSDAAQRLREQGSRDFGADVVPAARIRLPNAPAVFLVTALHPEHGHLAFGLVDLGLGPEIGEIDLADVARTLIDAGWTLEPDTDFEPGDARLSDYLTGAASPA